MSKVLVAERDEKVGRFLAGALRQHGYVVDECWTSADALRLVDLGGYDLVVMDAALGRLDGFAVCRRVRARGAVTPIFVLGAAPGLRERILAFESGADDVLVKPFEMDEVLARVRALLRRSVGYPATTLVCGDFELDCLKGTATLAGERLRCTARELAVLLFLAERRGEPVSRTELLVGVWSASFEGGSNAVDVHLCHLRSKLGSHAWMIETVRGKGYRLRSRPKG